MNNDLFRSEFREQRSRGDFGEVVMPSQRAVAVASIVFAIVLVGIIALLAFLPYTRMETALGFVVSDADSIAVTSAFQAPVRIRSTLVRDGEVVYPGKPLYMVELSTPDGARGDEHLSNGLVMLARSDAQPPGSPAIATILGTQQGYVDRFLMMAGDQVSSGQPVLVIKRAQGRIIFRVLVDSRSIAYLQAGQHAYVRVDSFPFQKFGAVAGHIVGVSGSSISPYQASMMFGIQPPSQSKFLVDVAVDDPASIGGVQSLKPGMNAYIDFPLEQMSVLKWLFSSMMRKGKGDGKG